MALLVAFEEELGADDAVFVDEVRSRMRDASEIFGAKLPAVHLRVANAEGVDEIAAFVGQKRELDAVLVREIFQDFDGVVADGCEVDVGFVELGFIGVQLNQLPLAVGSPIGGAVEHESNVTVGIEQGLQRAVFAVLIFEAKSRDLVPHFNCALHLFRGLLPFLGDRGR